MYKNLFEFAKKVVEDYIKELKEKKEVLKEEEKEEQLKMLKKFLEKAENIEKKIKKKEEEINKKIKEIEKKEYSTEEKNKKINKMIIEELDDGELIERIIYLTKSRRLDRVYNGQELDFHQIELIFSKKKDWYKRPWVKNFFKGDKDLIRAKKDELFFGQEHNEKFYHLKFTKEYGGYTIKDFFEDLKESIENSEDEELKKEMKENKYRFKKWIIEKMKEIMDTDTEKEIFDWYYNTYEEDYHLALIPQVNAVYNRIAKRYVADEENGSIIVDFVMIEDINNIHIIEFNGSSHYAGIMTVRDYEEIIMEACETEKDVRTFLKMQYIKKEHAIMGMKKAWKDVLNSGEVTYENFKNKKNVFLFPIQEYGEEFINKNILDELAFETQENFEGWKREKEIKKIKEENGKLLGFLTKLNEEFVSEDRRKDNRSKHKVFLYHFSEYVIENSLRRVRFLNLLGNIVHEIPNNVDFSGVLDVENLKEDYENIEEIEKKIKKREAIFYSEIGKIFSKINQQQENMII